MQVPTLRVHKHAACTYNHERTRGVYMHARLHPWGGARLRVHKHAVCTYTQSVHAQTCIRWWWWCLYIYSECTCTNLHQRMMMMPFNYSYRNKNENVRTLSLAECTRMHACIHTQRAQACCLYIYSECPCMQTRTQYAHSECTGVHACTNHVQCIPALCTLHAWRMMPCTSAALLHKPGCTSPSLFHAFYVIRQPACKQV